MKIKVVSRAWFMKRKGSPEEQELFRKWNILSICTPELHIEESNWDREEPPFSKEFLKSENLLCLYFHDTEKQWNDQIVLFSKGMARKIVGFVKSTQGNGKGFLIHCTAGKSRSQAVGLVLNEFLNRFLENHPEDYMEFEEENQWRRTPNSLVKSILWKEMEEFFLSPEDAYTLKPVGKIYLSPAPGGILSKEELRTSTLHHIQEVKSGLYILSDLLKQKGEHHDWTKLEFLEEFYSQFHSFQTTGEWGENGWYENQHLPKERHHLDPGEEPEGVDLLDVLEQIVDGVVSGISRTGRYEPRPLDPALLERAYLNTAKKVERLVERKR